MAGQFVTYGHLSSRSEGKPQTPLSEMVSSLKRDLGTSHYWHTNMLRFLSKSTEHNKKKTEMVKPPYTYHEGI